MAPDKFYFFPALPLEIQDSIWELCLPRRVIRPCYSEADVLNKIRRVPGNIGSLSVRALIPFRPPLISRVCQRAYATAMRCGQFTQVLTDIDATWDPTHESAWINKEDCVYFNLSSISNGLDHPCQFVEDAAPQVFEHARDVNRPLLIDSFVHSDDMDETDCDCDETVTSNLYNQFLKGRGHFYYVTVDVVIVVSGKDREEVIKTGLFGLLGEDTAIVPSTDKATLERYISLYDTYDYGEPEWHCAVLEDLDDEIEGRDKAGFEPRNLVRRILEDIVKQQGESDEEQGESDEEQGESDEGQGQVHVPVEDMIDEDDSLKLSHPLVQQFGITMPTWEKVVIFELRFLDTLLEDARRLSDMEELESD